MAITVSAAVSSLHVCSHSISKYREVWMAANGPKCRRVDDCDGSCPRVLTRNGFYFLLLRTGDRPEYRGGGDMGGPREQKHHPAAAGEKHKYGPQSSSLIRLRAAAAGAVI